MGRRGGLVLVVAVAVCLLAAGARGQHGGGDTSTVTPMCVAMPTMPECASYEMPDDMVEADIASLCGMMPYMSGCSIRDSCGEDGEDDGDCEDFRVLKVLCLDMPGMSGCKNYNLMCAAGSVVQQCAEEVADVPRTMDTDEMIQDMCSSHFMSSCSDYYQCSAEPQTAETHCDLLRIYSTLCLSMSGMPDCAEHDAMCDTMESDLGYCPGSAHGTPPVMRMFFHTGEKEYILFESWVPESTGAYAGSWVAIFLLGLSLEFFRACRAFFEYTSAPPDCECASKKSLSRFVYDRPFRPLVDLARGLLHFVDVCIALLLMLVVMTFNVGLFFAVAFGAGVGHFLFGRYYASIARGPACH